MDLCHPLIRSFTPRQQARNTLLHVGNRLCSPDVFCARRKQERSVRCAVILGRPQYVCCDVQRYWADRSIFVVMCSDTGQYVCCDVCQVGGFIRHWSTGLNFVEEGSFRNERFLLCSAAANVTCCNITYHSHYSYPSHRHSRLL